MIDNINRHNIDLAFIVQEQIRQEFTKADEQRGHLIERLQYEADPARCRFYEVDPAHRLVAATLESEWNDRLQKLRQAQPQRDEFRQTHEALLSDRQRQRIEQLTEKFKQVWHYDKMQNQVDQAKVQLRLCGAKAVTLESLELRTLV